MKHAWVFGAVLLVACGNNASVVERPGNPAVVNFERDDEEMARAVEQARDTVEKFIEELPELRERGDYFSVKVPIQAGSGTEHIWLDAPTFENGSFHGKIGNEPLEGPLKLGDRVITPLAVISDWMAVRDGELYGGFTVLVVRARMSPEQQSAFDESVGFRVPAAARSF